jgi:hypothetical protein
VLTWGLGDGEASDLLFFFNTVVHILVICDIKFSTTVAQQLIGCGRQMSDIRMDYSSSIPAHVPF